jgi:hypothetical protein
MHDNNYIWKQSIKAFAGRSDDWFRHFELLLIALNYNLLSWFISRIARCLKKTITTADDECRTLWSDHIIWVIWLLPLCIQFQISTYTVRVLSNCTDLFYSRQMFMSTSEHTKSQFLHFCFYFFFNGEKFHDANVFCSWHRHNWKPFWC